MVGMCDSVISNAGVVFKRLASGDLSNSWKSEDGIDLKGDFLQLHDDANTTTAQLNDIVSRLKDNAAIVSSSSTNVLNTNNELEANASIASRQANSVSSAVNSIAENVDSIAGAAQEMTTSVSEIAKNADRSSAVAEEAANLTKKADGKLSKLAQSSQDIGAMIKVINSIAEQTNLLALNATIEAARAGETGKGFAVVANEVKDLAKETARATEDISEKIKAIQNDSVDAASSIREIDSIVVQINELQAETAAAMQQQLSLIHI